MYKYLFGPVPSRRLGMSLGVDLVPHKVCSFDCIYCECGATTKLTSNRKEYIKYDKVIIELDHYFNNNKEPDYITFSGSGEPTLNSRIGDLISFIKEKKPNIPIAVLTNGTLLNNKQVRKELVNADVVLPSLDVASDETMQKLNKPDKSFSVDTYIQGIVDFSNEFKGKIWLEVLIIPGYNDNKTDLDLLKDAIIKINPTSVQLNTLDRPGVLSNLRAASRLELEQIAKYWALDNIELIASAPSRKSIDSYREDIETAIYETLMRRPCTLTDLVQILGSHINEVNKYLDVLEADGKIKVVMQERGMFYKVAKKK